MNNNHDNDNDYRDWTTLIAPPILVLRQVSLPPFFLFLFSFFIISDCFIICYTCSELK